MRRLGCLILAVFVGLFAVLGDIALIDGLASYAQYKGYSARWAILGLLAVFPIYRLLLVPLRRLARLRAVTE